MASTAAVLNIMVAANTAPASGQLLALQKQLAATTAQANTTSTTVGGGLSKGGKMAAVGLGAAAVAAIGVGKALSASVRAASSFESSFAEVRKTVDTNEAGFRRIERGLRNLAKQIPTPVEELNNLAGEAGALGIAAKNIVTFTRVAAQLGTTTNLSSSDAANALARLANIMGTSSSKFENLASTLVGLGNAGASTESEIADMSLRIASTGKQVGLSEAQVLGFASALSSVGIEAEAGGSAISRAFSLISTSVATGNEDLAGFARVAQMSVPQFSKLFERNAAKGMLAFIKGLGEIKENGGNALVELEKLGINEIRLRNALLSAAGAGELFNNQLRQASAEFQSNTALAAEAQQRYDTLSSQFTTFKNRINDVAISVGQKLTPVLKGALGVANDFFDDLFGGARESSQDDSKWFPSPGNALKQFLSDMGEVAGAINSVASLTAKQEDKPSIFQRIATGAPEALGVIQNFTGRLKVLRANQVKTADAAKAAEQRLNQIRRQHGPSSQQAIIAEAEYRQALQRSAKAQRKLEQAQKLTGPVRRATINLVKEEVKGLKTEIQRRKNAIQVLGAQLALEDGKSKESKKRVLRLSELIKNAARKQAGAQSKLNQIIAESGVKIGPKFAKSLERMKASTSGFRSALGRLKKPAQDGRKEFEGLSKSAEKSARRIKTAIKGIPGPVRGAYGRLANYANNAAEAFGSNDRVRLSFRRGGMAKFSGPGLVPAMVSPGELISYKGREVYVPGRPEPRDSVMMHLPPGAKVFTFDGQARLAMGASQNDALRKQAPHFATGGIVANAPKPKLVGGPRVPRATGQSAIDRGREQAMDWVKKLKPTLDMITRIARGFGLDMTSGYRPGDDGYHGVDRARDYSNSSGPTREMFKFGTYVADNYQKHLLELIYTPLGFGIKNGARTAPYAAADHYDHVHVAMQKGGIVPRFKKGGWVKTGYTVFDDVMGYRGPLSGKAYAELGAPNGGVGYISRLLGINKELPKDFPLDVKIKGKTTKLYKRDIGYGQGTSDYSIDIWKSMWPFYGLNSFSKGPAWIRSGSGKASAAAKKEEKRKERKIARKQKRILKRISGKFGKYPGREKIQSIQGMVNKLNESIEINERDFGADWSAGGSEIDPVDWSGRKPGASTERGQLVAQYEELLKLYQRRRNLIVRAVKWLKELIARYKVEIKAIETGKTQRYKGKKVKPRAKWQLKGFKKGIGNAKGAIGELNEARVELEGLTGQAGLIGDTKFNLLGLGYKVPAEAPDSVDGDSEIADLLREQLQQTQRSLAISQAQMPIFQQFMPRFHQGGIVQGPTGAERPVMAQAGEGIFTRDQMRAMGSQNITVVIEDAAIDSNRIRVEVDGVIQDKVSTVRRQGSNRRFVTSR